MRRADVVKIEPNRASFAAARKMLAALSESSEAMKMPTGTAINHDKQNNGTIVKERAHG